MYGNRLLEWRMNAKVDLGCGVNSLPMEGLD